MRPELEQIDIRSTEQSFRFFKIEAAVLAPYWHYHPEMELTFIKKGKGTRFIGDAISPFFDLDLVLVGENLPHHWVSTYKGEASGEQECYVFQFPMILLQSIKECQSFLPLLTAAQRGIYFRNLPEELVDLILNFEALNNIQRLGALLNILDQLNRHTDRELLTSKSYRPISLQTRSQLKFSLINNYILEHLDQKLSVNELADIAHMVPQSFCRWFKQHSGHSFVTFLQLARIENASQLLLTTALPIQEIAYASGFETLSHFNRTFKKYKQKSPRAYKKSTLNLF